MDDLFPETVNKGVDGTIWWDGNWECRNFNGYFQSREEGVGEWCFQVNSFGEDECDIYALSDDGTFCEKAVPIDRQNRITVLGKKYNQKSWSH